MKTPQPSTIDDSVADTPSDTTRVLMVKPERLPGEAEPLDRTDAWASTDSWKLGPEQQLDFEREAELGALRSNLASMAESRGYLENSLRSLTSSLRELETRLLEESQRTAGHEADLRAREAELAEARHELEAARAQWAGGETERAALLQQVQALQENSAAQMRAIELLEAARREDQDAAQAMLLEQEASAAHAQVRVQQLQATLQETIAGRDAEMARLVAELAAARGHGEGLQQSLQSLGEEHAGLRSRHEALQSEHGTLRSEHDALLAGAEELRTEQGHQLDMVRALNEQLDLARSGHEQALNDLRIAEERIRAADVELRNRDARIERLGASEQEHKARAEKFARRLAERDGLIQRLEREAESSAAVLGKIQSNLSSRLDKEDSALPRDLVARLLVRNDGNTEIVQVLGRRTLIGRGVDCQLQIDAEFVSRRHALVLVMPDETVVEDLNSTNGVYVNGTRVSRRRLSEGDNITIGRTVFRYVLKPVAERSS